MKILDTVKHGGVPYFNNDINMLQSISNEQLVALCKAIGYQDSEKYILYGCNVTLSGTTPTYINISAGAAFIDGEVYMCDSQSINTTENNYTINDVQANYFWAINQTIDVAGDRITASASPISPYVVRKLTLAKISSGTVTVTPYLYGTLTYLNQQDSPRVVKKAEYYTNTKKKGIEFPILPLQTFHPQVTEVSTDVYDLYLHEDEHVFQCNVPESLGRTSYIRNIYINPDSVFLGYELNFIVKYSGGSQGNLIIRGNNVDSNSNIVLNQQSVPIGRYYSATPTPFAVSTGMLNYSSFSVSWNVPRTPSYYDTSTGNWRLRSDFYPSFVGKGLVCPGMSSSNAANYAMITLMWVGNDNTNGYWIEKSRNNGYLLQNDSFFVAYDVFANVKGDIGTGIIDI